MPRARSSSLNEAIAFDAPRILNEPVRWSDSALQKTSASISDVAAAECTTGVRVTNGAILRAASSTSIRSIAGDSTIEIPFGVGAHHGVFKTAQRPSMTERDRGEEPFGPLGPRVPGDEPVETGRVVRLDQMGEFVHDHVVENPGGESLRRSEILTAPVAGVHDPQRVFCRDDQVIVAGSGRSNSRAKAIARRERSITSAERRAMSLVVSSATCFSRCALASPCGRRISIRSPTIRADTVFFRRGDSMMRISRSVGAAPDVTECRTIVPSTVRARRSTRPARLRR